MPFQKLTEWIEQKLLELIDSYNEFTYEWLRGYKKCLNDILKFIKTLK
jgi:hypothetical protein